MPLSVHLCDYPVYNESERDRVKEEEMRVVMKAVEMGRSLRAQSNLKIRQPLKEFVVVSRNKDTREILEKDIDILKEELNVKSVFVRKNEEDLVSYSAKANFKVLGAKLGKSMKEVASHIQGLVGEKISNILNGESEKIKYSDGEIDVTEGDLVIQRTEKEHVKVLNEGELTVGYDTEVTEDLLLEGISRDLVRLVQTERKDIGLDVADHINLTLWGDENFRKAVEVHKDFIMKETLSSSLTVAENNGRKADINESEVSVLVEKV